MICCKKLFCIIILVVGYEYAKSQDTNLPKNWHLLDKQFDGIYGISLNEAYKLVENKPSKPVIVALTEYTIDITHEDLKDRIWVNSKEIDNNMIDDDGNGYTDDRYGWNFLTGNNKIRGTNSAAGTYMAGIIGAIRNNGKGIDGIADNVRIMTAYASFTDPRTDRHLAMAIRYAVDNGAKIIVTPVIHEGTDEILKAIKYAGSKNVLLIESTGVGNTLKIQNEDFQNVMGKSRDNVLIVGASGPTLDNLFTEVDGYGKNTVDVMAPAPYIYSLTSSSLAENQGETTDSCGCNSGMCKRLTAKSDFIYGAVVAAGVAAFVLSYYPDLTVKQLKYIIEKSVIFPPTGTKVTISDGSQILFSELSKTGGIVNACNAINIAAKIKGN